MVVKYKYPFMARERFFYQRVGKIVRKARENQGISQRQLGELLGFSENDTRISYWENAKREISLYDYLRVMEVLECDPWLSAMVGNDG